MEYYKDFDNYINEKYISWASVRDERTVYDLAKLDIFLNALKVCNQNSEYTKTKEYKLFKKFLSEKKENLIHLYHGTSVEHDVIRGNEFQAGNGLLVTTNKTKKSLQSETGYVYLSLYPDSAKTFGSIAYPRTEIAVYEVTVPIYLLKPDTDQLRNKRLWGEFTIGDSLAESFIFGSGARVKGNIPPYMIKIHNGL